jgi:hypothetical protein
VGGQTNRLSFVKHFHVQFLSILPPYGVIGDNCITVFIQNEDGQGNIRGANRSRYVSCHQIQRSIRTMNDQLTPNVSFTELSAKGAH